MDSSALSALSSSAPEFAKLTPWEQVKVLQREMAEKERQHAADLEAAKREMERMKGKSTSIPVEDMVAEQVRQQLAKLSLSPPGAAGGAGGSAGAGSSTEPRKSGTSFEPRKLFTTPGVSGGTLPSFGTAGGSGSAGTMPHAKMSMWKLSKKLNGPGDYSNWVWDMTLMLEEHGLWGVVSGSVPVPAA